MKKVTLLASTLALALTASVQAAELVKVETLNNNVLTANVSIELAQSLKTMSTITLNVEKSAETILVAQHEKKVKTTDVEITTDVVTAE